MNTPQLPSEIIRLKHIISICEMKFSQTEKSLLLEALTDVQLALQSQTHQSTPSTLYAEVEPQSSPIWGTPIQAQTEKITETLPHTPELKAEPIQYTPPAESNPAPQFEHKIEEIKPQPIQSFQQLVEMTPESKPDLPTPPTQQTISQANTQYPAFHKILTLVDKFFIQRELFQNSPQKFESIMQKFDACSHYSEALEIAAQETGAPENIAYKTLITTLQRKFNA